ncbi:MAG: hypothetical protein CSB16_01105 [Clostridiales bacterium]|nr:MAG: hypothetical protein CSB16_01105 [Clostridiales bacterium]
MKKKSLLSVIFIVVLVAVNFLLNKGDSDRIKVKSLYVIDGDTIKILINGEKKTVRIIGMDAPEYNHPDRSRITEEGKDARKILINKIPENAYVEIEYDEDRKDKYGRILAHVYYEDYLVSKWMIERGYAKRVYVAPNAKYQDILREAERHAKDNQLGYWTSLWSDDE